MKQLLFSAALIFALVAWPAPAGQAGEDWCENDPLVDIVTPRGNHIVLYVTSGALGVQHLPSVLLARISYQATPVQGGTATLVKLMVVVPDDGFGTRYPTRTVVSTGPLKTGTILGSASGFSGQAMQVVFTLNVP